MDQIETTTGRAPLGTLSEIVTTQRNQLAEDFRAKSQSVLSAVGTDFISKGDDGVAIFMPVQDAEGQTRRFETEVLHKSLRRLTDLLEQEEYEDGSKHAVELMGELGRIAQLFPDRIPRYFADYRVNRALAFYPYQNGDETIMTYYPDGAIEAWQTDKEALILYALESASEGKKLPSTWRELQEMYTSSKK